MCRVRPNPPVFPESSRQSTGRFSVRSTRSTRVRAAVLSEQDRRTTRQAGQNERSLPLMLRTVRPVGRSERSESEVHTRLTIERTRE